MINVKGIIHFDPLPLTTKHKKQAKWKNHANVQLNCELDKYYAWFVKTRYNVKLNPPQRGPHVSFIADIVSNPELYKKVMEKWNKKEIEFTYDTNVRTNGEDWWLRVYSKDLLDIREEAGLPRNPFFNLHLTIGYAAPRLDKDGNEMGGSNLEHSRYIHEIIKRYEFDTPRKLT